MLFTAGRSHAQLTRSDESVSNQVYLIILNTTWEKEPASRQFVIGVLDSDTTLYALLRKKYQGLQIRRKSVRIAHFRSLEDLSPTAVLVVDNKYNRSIKSIYQAIPQKGCLLITISSGKSAYNMVDFNGRLKKLDFSVNRENLSKAGLQIAEAFRNPDDIITREEIPVDVPVIQKETEVRYFASQNSPLKPASYYKNLSLEEKIALLDKQTDLLQLQEAKILQQDSIVRRQQARLNRLTTEVRRHEKKLREQKATLGQQETMIIIFIVMLGFIGLAALLVINMYRNNRTLLHEISGKNALIGQQNTQLENVLGNVTDSIRYAHRIQHAVLPGAEQLAANLNKKHFILFRPKDIVSGDFYFVEKKDNKTVVAVADCTGHGVPGAFVGMLCQGLLHQIIQYSKNPEPAAILNELRKKVIQALQQKGLSGEQMDGLDISLLVFDQESSRCQWAGANTSLYHISAEGKLHEFKPDRRPISIYPDMRDFTNVELTLKKGDRCFLFSDGFQDQFGGPNGKKFMAKNFRRTLESTHSLPIEQQGKELEKILVSWMDEGEITEQIDDITVFGIEV